MIPPLCDASPFPPVGYTVVRGPGYIAGVFAYSVHRYDVYARLYTLRIKAHIYTVCMLSGLVLLTLLQLW